MLAPGLQRALWEMRWRDLRPIQREAILAWNEARPAGEPGADVAERSGPARPDLLVMAQTAGGKTEAAFLPILSQIAHEPEGSIRALYVGPLKALINDQFERVELLCRHLDMPVHRWHGDVGDSAKAGLLAAPSGVLLITPESLESLIINRTPRLGALLGGLRAVVIDELHAFLENERGLHLASLLARITPYVQGGERPRRVGLSATIGDPMAAAAYLCPDAPASVRMIQSRSEQKELLLRVHWYDPPVEGCPSEDGRSTPTARPDDAESASPPDDPATAAIAGDLVTHMHDSTNLVFANAKGRIELLADAANLICRERGLEERFHVHHGSLSRALREDVEREMKEPSPDTAICSSTLEMGIDIGSVRTVGQVGPPWSVASLKQRLGRSGRRDGESRRLRLYLTNDAHPESGDPERRLPLDLIQSVAVLELMLRQGWVEPPRPSTLDLSTLTQQIVSTIAQTGGVRAAELFQRLCVAGPFRAVTPALLARVLRCLGERDVVEQLASGELILGLKGEELRAAREFYATFQTPREYTVRAGDAVLGALPITVTPREGDQLVLAARRWQVASVDPGRLEVLVTPARGARRALFAGSVGEVHPRIRHTMLEVLAAAHTTGLPAPYLDAGAKAALRNAAALAHEHDLARRRIIETSPSSCQLLTWSGTRVQATVAAMLASQGITATPGEITIACKSGADEVRAALALPTLPALGLARHVEPKVVRKYDQWLDVDVLDESIAVDRLDIDGATAVVGELIGSARAP